MTPRFRRIGSEVIGHAFGENRRYPRSDLKFTNAAGFTRQPFRAARRPARSVREGQLLPVAALTVSAIGQVLYEWNQLEERSVLFRG
jgi:hypothetical protein